MLKNEVVLAGFGPAPEKYPPQPRSLRPGMRPPRTKHPVRSRPGASRFSRLVRRSLRVLRPSRAEVRLQKHGASWVVSNPVKEQRFQVIDSKGGVIDTWRLRASIARFERGEGERVDLDTVRERFGLPPGK